MTERQHRWTDDAQDGEAEGGPSNDRGRRPGPSRRAVLRAAAGAVGAAALPGRGGATAAAQATPAASPTPDATGRIPSPAPGVPDAYVSLPPPFSSVEAVPGSGGTITAIVPSYVAPVPGRDQNQFWQELERWIGVTYEPTLVPASTYAERIATTLAGGDLPDFMWVDLGNLPNLGELIEQGAFTDLTDYLTGDALREYPNLARIDPTSWRGMTVEGRLWAVPRPRFRAGGSLAFRQSWTETLGFPAIPDAETWFQFMVACLRGDPNGNGQADTWGLGSLSGGFFNQVFRVPNTWRLNPDGTLTHQVETEEYRASLAFVRRMFAEGIFLPDVTTRSIQQLKDDFVAGRFAGYSDGVLALPGSRGLRGRAKEFDPTANVIGLVPFGHDGGQAVTYNGGGNAGYTAIPASAGGDEERLRELLRIMDYFAAPFGSEERIFLNYGLPGVHHEIQEDGTLALSEQGRTELGGEVRSDLAGIMYEPPALYYPDAPGDAAYMQGLIADLLAIGIDDPTFGLYPPAAAEQGAVLGSLLGDQEIAIITGREPIDSVDQLVEDWRSRGGDLVRGQFEEAIAARS